MDFLTLRQNLTKDFSDFKRIKIALLGDSSTQFLAQSLRGYAYEYQFAFELFESEYNQVEQEISSPNSELYHFSPVYLFLFLSTQKLQKDFYKKPGDEKTTFAEDTLKKIEHLLALINAKTNTKILLPLFSEINDYSFGNFATKVEQSLIYQLKKLNFLLMEFAKKCPNLFLIDLPSLERETGDSLTRDKKLYISGDFIYHIDFFPIIAKHVCDIIAASLGKIKKCLIVDLDNTLWGGIIGEDGIERIQIGGLGIGKAFTELQQWILELKNRGIILAVCSKNDEDTAKEPFQKHQEMVLRLDDFALFLANRNSKAENIKYLKSVLNIGFDSMVFVDDSPFERNLVKSHFPEICVPELPEDPVEYLTFLQKLNLFETTSYSEEDQNRTKQYQQESQRTASQMTFSSEDEYLESLEMKCNVKPFDSFTIPRIAQLTQRSNQFNLRTIRYSESDIKSITSSDEYIALSFSLKDKFGDNGLISAVILKKETETLFLDTFIMSCRVLRRGVEFFILNQLCKIAEEKGFAYITGEYIQTSKNGLVKNLLADLGFTQKNDIWQLAVGSYMPNKTFISKD